jgi:N-acetylglutamate synthase/N-acetylornithine aminotransferase
MQSKRVAEVEEEKARGSGVRASWLASGVTTCKIPAITMLRVSPACSAGTVLTLSSCRAAPALGCTSVTR